MISLLTNRTNLNNSNNIRYIKDLIHCSSIVIAMHGKIQCFFVFVPRKPQNDFKTVSSHGVKTKYAIRHIMLLWVMSVKVYSWQVKNTNMVPETILF